MKKILYCIFSALLIFNVGVYAQSDSVVVVPDWYTTPPVAKGKLYSVATGESSDMLIAKKKAREQALIELTNIYKGHFEFFSVQCDTLLGQDNKAREIITTVVSKQQALLTGVEVFKTEFFCVKGKYICYLLLQMSISDDIKAIQNEINADELLKKQMKEKGLLKQIANL